MSKLSFYYTRDVLKYGKDKQTGKKPEMSITDIIAVCQQWLDDSECPIKEASLVVQTEDALLWIDKPIQ